MNHLQQLLAAPPSRPTFLDDEPRVLVYGAGNVGRAVLDCLTRRGRVVPCLLDRRATPGMTAAGVPVLQADDPTLTADIRRTTPVVIAVFNYETDLRLIFKGLRESGYGKVASIVQVYDWFLPELGDRFWLTGRESLRANAAAITEAAGVWADDASRAMYSAVVEYRLTGNHELLPEPNPERQYLPHDVPTWHTPVRLIDGGAYPGDTLAAFLRKDLAVEAAALFEPDPGNYAALVEFARRELSAVPDLTLWPCALGAETGQLTFEAGHGEASRLALGGGTVVQCVALDDVLPRFRPTLVKLDVEGAEYDTLCGAARTVRELHPELAVCLYHRPEHLWQIPLALRLWNPAYRLYLRLHTFNGFELVLYAQSQEK